MKSRKGLSALLAVLCALVLTACAGTPVSETAPPEETPAPTETTAPTESPAPTETPVPAPAEDLAAILTGLDLTGATLTYFMDESEAGSYDAGAAIGAEGYLDTLRGYAWERIEPYPAWAEDSGYRYELTAGDVAVTAFQSYTKRPVRLTLAGKESWYTVPVEGGYYSWEPYETLSDWYGEAEAATLYKGSGTPLTVGELNWWKDYTNCYRSVYDPEWGGSTIYTTPISCFFTSTYSDPRDMDAGDWLYYCPDQGHLYGEKDEAEFTLVQTRLDWRDGDGNLLPLSDLPIPCHRYPRAYVNEILTEYAGLTLEDMHTNWLEELLYIPETDCFYGFASDFGPGRFTPRYGEREGDIVILYGSSLYIGYDSDSNAAVVRFQKAGEGWYILSHLAAE